VNEENNVTPGGDEPAIKEAPKIGFRAWFA
jgi:hypothetical protein